MHKDDVAGTKREYGSADDSAHSHRRTHLTHWIATLVFSTYMGLMKEQCRRAVSPSSRSFSRCLRPGIMLRHLVFALALAPASGLRMSRRGLCTSMAAAAAAPSSLSLSFASDAAPTTASARLAAEATSAFERADYLASERLWRQVTMEAPDDSLAWANLAINLIITASEEMELGKPPEGRAKERLDECLRAIEQAEALDVTPDALTLNSKGNALGLQLRWADARVAYAASADASPRSFESIPRSNEILAMFELGALAEAERKTTQLIRRDPAFRDARALLATLRYERGDVGGAASAISDLCSGPGGAAWCDRYSSSDVVMGRWSPRAVRAYQGLLKEKAIQLELREGQAPKGSVRSEYYVPSFPLL